MPGPSARPGSSPFRFLVGSGLSYAGVDQGIDFTGAGPVFSPATARVTRVQRSGSGWPGEGAVLNLQLLDGPKAGQHIYVAEDFAPSVSVGQVVKRGDTIGQATGSGKAPGIEIGWAQPSGIPVAPLPPPRPADQRTAPGSDFLAWVTGGAGPPPATIGSVTSHIPGVVQAEGVVGAVTSVAGFLGRLTDPSYLLRGLQVMAGAVLVLTGVILLARQVALAADLPDPPIPVPVPV